MYVISLRSPFHVFIQCKIIFPQLVQSLAASLHLVLSKGNTYVDKSASGCFRAIFNWESKVHQDCIGFIFVHYLIGVENLRHSFGQSDARTITDHHLVPCVFPRFWQIACFYFEFLLTSGDIFLPSGWLLWFLSFHFNNIQLKSALCQD